MDESFNDDLSGASVERTVELNSDVETTWSHLVDGDLLTAWMGAPVEIDPRVGGRIRMEPGMGDPVWGTVEDVEEKHRIQWSWRTDDGMPTLVEIALDPTEFGTKLTVRETMLPWRVTGPDLRASASLAA